MRLIMHLFCVCFMTPSVTPPSPFMIFFHILPIVLYARHLAKIPACPMIMLKPGGPMKTQFQWAPSYTKQRISNPTTAWACPNDRVSIGFRVRGVRVILLYCDHARASKNVIWIAQQWCEIADFGIKIVKNV